jgi:cbb3-type cytochrome oxidase subunit 3
VNNLSNIDPYRIGMLMGLLLFFVGFIAFLLFVYKRQRQMEEA